MRTRPHGRLVQWHISGAGTVCRSLGLSIERTQCRPVMWDPRSRVERRSHSGQRFRSRLLHRFRFSSRSSANQELSPSFNENPPTPNRCWGILVGSHGLTVSQREPRVHQGWVVELSLSHDDPCRRSHPGWCRCDLGSPGDGGLARGRRDARQGSHGVWLRLVACRCCSVKNHYQLCKYRCSLWPIRGLLRSGDSIRDPPP